MHINAEEIACLIEEQGELVVRAVEEFGSEKVLPERFSKFCKPGHELAIIHLALMDDCLFAIEEIVFSTCEETGIEAKAIHDFLRPLARQYAKKDPSRYAGFANLQAGDCGRFLKTHYYDSSAFGGASRFTKWLGFKLVRAVAYLRSDNKLFELYSGMIQGVIGPIIAWDFRLSSDCELNSLLKKVRAHSVGLELGREMDRDAGRSKGLPEMADLGSDSLLFDVRSTRDNPLSVVLNKSHIFFREKRSFYLLLESWAEMEINAWDKRKQLIGDIRSDWGRIIRDAIIAEES